jgi:hypothetical protein
MDETFLCIIMFNKDSNGTAVETGMLHNFSQFIIFCIHGRVQMSSLSDSRNHGLNIYKDTKP